MKKNILILSIYLLGGCSILAAAEEYCNPVLAEGGDVKQLACLLTRASRQDDQDAKKYWLNVGALLDVEGYATEYSYFYHNENEFEQVLAERRIEEVLMSTSNESVRSKSYWVLASIAEDKGDAKGSFENYSLSALYGNRASMSSLIRLCAEEKLQLCVFLWGNIFVDQISTESRYYEQLNNWLSVSKIYYIASWGDLLKDLRGELSKAKKDEDFITSLNMKVLKEKSP